MKGITGHRVLDAYANMALTPVRQVRQNGQDTAGTANHRGADARRLAAGAVSDPVRIENLQEKVALGPGAFDTNVVAQRLVGELTG